MSTNGVSPGVGRGRNLLLGRLHRAALSRDASQQIVQLGNGSRVRLDAGPGRADRLDRFFPTQARVALDADEIRAQGLLGFLEAAPILRAAAVADAIGRRVILVVKVRA